MQRTSKIAEESGFIPVEACGLLDDVNLLYLASSTTPRRRNLQVALAQYMVTHFRSSSTKSLSWLLSSLICMVCGRELAAKVVVLSARCVLTRIVHEYMIATSAFSKMLMLHFSLHAEKLEVERERAVILRRACKNIGLFPKHIVSVIQVYTYCIKCKFNWPCCRKSVYQVKWKHSLILAWCGMSLGRYKSACKLS